MFELSQGSVLPDLAAATEEDFKVLNAEAEYCRLEIKKLDITGHPLQQRWVHNELHFLCEIKGFRCIHSIVRLLERIDDIRYSPPAREDSSEYLKQKIREASALISDKLRGIFTTDWRHCLDRQRWSWFLDFEKYLDWIALTHSETHRSLLEDWDERFAARHSASVNSQAQQ